jgi:hypothetical protein
LNFMRNCSLLHLFLQHCEEKNSLSLFALLNLL